MIVREIDVMHPVKHQQDMQKHQGPGYLVSMKPQLYYARINQNTSLCLHIFICKMERVAGPTSQGCGEN